MKKRILSIALALCMVLSCVVPVSFAVTSEDARGTENKSAYAEGYVTLDGVHLDYETYLTQNPDGTYTLRVDARATETMEEKNVNTRVSKDGFYEVERTGRYLIELWGGNGADAPDNGGQGGKGGAGGYVYGIIDLKVGETLYFNLGGNGEQTQSTTIGGGANGAGGAHGGSGSTTVGGGGGYSAIYLFDSADFAIRYTNGAGKLTQEKVLESDRISKYIMIAGGGGGGGGFSGDHLRTPDGGAGGSMSSVSGALSGSEYAVNGTFYVGADGKSSGNSTAYVGKGGSNVPGAVIDTILSLHDGQQPNDWNGTYNASKEGGSGGAGNLRGGSGGAGFCGGSGGLMTSILSPRNVGGGGGGSSFVSSYFKPLGEGEENFLVGTNPSTLGGGVAITYIEEHDLSYLSDLTFSAQATKFFHIKSVSASNLDLQMDYEAVFDNDSHEAKLEHVAAPLGTTFEFEIVFRPNREFAGGNNVPLMDDDDDMANTPLPIIHITSPTCGGDLLVDDACAYVNVPLNFSVFTRNHSTNIPGLSHATVDLYRDDYVELREQLQNGTADWHYFRIASLSEYRVTDLQGNLITDAVSPTETTKYNVSFTVTPKSFAETGVAVVGKVVTETVVTGTALVEITGSHVDVLYGNWITYAKDVDYDEESGLYSLSLRVKSDTNVQYGTPPEFPKYEFSTTNVQTTYIEYSGYYFFQLWGGNGGKGGDGGLFGSGASGGKGGYVSGFVYLEEGTYIHAHMGANGEDGAGRTGIFQYGTGGEGGHASSIAVITLDENGAHTIQYYIAVAAGGGGASASGGSIWMQSDPGDSVTDTKNQTIPEKSLDSIFASYSGQTGGEGQNQGGSAGVNVLDPTYINVLQGDDVLTEESLAYIASASESDYTNAGGGAFYLKCLQGDLAMHEGDRATVLTDYSIDLNFAKYFDFVSASLVNADGVASAAPKANVTVKNGISTVTVSEIAPHQTVTGNGNSSVTTVDYTVTLYFSPKEGFLGGNDVPLIDVSEAAIAATGRVTGMTLTQTYADKTDTIDINEERTTDYVNVAIAFDPSSINEDVLSTKDAYYFIGDEPILLSELYTLNNALLPTLPSDWRADFVEISLPNGSLTLAPSATTPYEIFVGIAPKTPSNYSVVAEEAEPIGLTKQATVRVGYEVTYEIDPALLGIVAVKDERTGKYFAQKGKIYESQLSSLSEENSLPASIVVTVDGVRLSIEASDYTWDSAEGLINIAARCVTGDIHIKAESPKKQYTVHYVVQNLPNSEESTTYTAKYHAGDEIQDEHLLYTPAAVSGYRFVWNWGDGSEEPLTHMPARDLWIVGSYKALEYSLSVRYESEEGELLDELSAKYFYGSNYSILHPSFEGYRVKDGSALLEGTVTADTTITVVYEKIVGILHIIYVKSDTNTVIEERELSYVAGASYSVPSPSVSGYHTAQTSVSGTMPQSGAGVTVYVNYEPNVYRVSLNAVGGSVSPEKITVVYGKTYNFNGTYYEALPDPVRVGYRFEGWYLGEEKITDESIVSVIAENGANYTLTARWSADVFSVTLRFLLPDGSEVMSDIVIKDVAYGSAYSYSSSDYSHLLPQEYREYTVAPTVYSGMMPAQNTVLVFTYYPPVQDEVVSVTVSFGSLSFVGEFGEWNTETLSYEPDVISPENGESNKITVSSGEESTVSVNVFLQYAKKADYGSIDGYFTAENSADARHKNEMTLAPSTSADAYLWLTGRLRLGAPNGVCGTVTVTVVAQAED